MQTTASDSSPPHAVPRVMALDVGDKRIGLAITDALGVTAQPLFTIHRRSGASGLKHDLKSIGRFIRQHAVSLLVVGLPLHADGAVSAQSAKTLEFVEQLKTALAEAQPALRVEMLDERLTTKEAHGLLDGGGRRTETADRVKRKELIDQVAAVLLLEAWLSREHGPALLPDPDLV